MKRPIHLYIFAILSAISCLLKVFNVFFAKYNEEAMRQLLQQLGTVDESVLTFARESFQFQTGIVNKVFAVLLLLALSAVIALLFLKKNEQASYAYLGYLFGTLLFHTYTYMGTKGLAQLYSDSVMRQTVEAQAIVGYIIGIVLFAIYFGLTVFFHLRKPKEKPSVAATSTDI